MAMQDVIDRIFKQSPANSRSIVMEEGATFSPQHDAFYIVDGTDNTKRVNFSLAGVPTGTTRTLVLPATNGKVLAYQFARVDAATSLAGDTTDQPLFAAAGDTLAVIGATSYRFRCAYRLTTGATSVTVSFLFGGDATFTTCNYIAFATDAASGTPAAATLQNAEAATAVVVNAAGTGVNKRAYIEGEFETNAGGTIIPSIKFSADPQGTETVNVGSFFEIWELGDAPVTTIGAWS
jgi:hypothetical protein